MLGKFSMVGVIFIIIGILLSGFVGSMVWPYVFNTWAEVLDLGAHMTKTQGFLLGLVPGLGQLWIPGAILTAVLSPIFR